MLIMRTLCRLYAMNTQPTPFPLHSRSIPARARHELPVFPDLNTPLPSVLECLWLPFRIPAQPQINLKRMLKNLKRLNQLETPTPIYQRLTQISPLETRKNLKRQNSLVCLLHRTSPALSHLPSRSLPSKRPSLRLLARFCQPPARKCDFLLPDIDRVLPGETHPARRASSLTGSGRPS
jgi:hypothetical protein